MLAHTQPRTHTLLLHSPRTFPPPPPLVLSATRLANSTDSADLVQFFQFYGGIGGIEKFAELTVSLHNGSVFESSDVAAMRGFTSAAIAFKTGRWQIQPPGVSSVIYSFDNSTLWFSAISFEHALPDVLHAEAERDAGDLIYAYSADVNPNGSFPESSWRGDLSNITIRMPPNPDGLPDANPGGQGFLPMDANGLPGATGPDGRPMVGPDGQPIGGPGGQPGAAQGASAGEDAATAAAESDGAKAGGGGADDGGISVGALVAAVLAGVLLSVIAAAIVAFVAVRHWRRRHRAAGPAGRKPGSANGSSDAAQPLSGWENGHAVSTPGTRSATAVDSGHAGAPFLATGRGAGFSSFSTDDGEGDRTPEPHRAASSRSYRSPAGGPSAAESTDSESPEATGVRAMSAGARSSDMGSGIGTVRERVAAAVQEMQGALQAELQEDQLKLHGMVGRGGFGTVYHGALSSPAALCDGFAT